MTITVEIAPVIVNVYTNGTVIVNAFTLKEAISPVIVNVYTNGSVYTYGCYIACRGEEIWDVFRSGGGRFVNGLKLKL